jgi:hypothetical protein
LKRSKETPRRKPRHDDSQIIFEAVESSPIIQETQNLTERQREVAEQQTSDAAIFRDIRSSPRPTSSKQSLIPHPPPLDSDLDNQSDVVVCSSDQEEPQSSPPSSPQLGPNELQSEDNDQPPSSPLVASVKRKRKQPPQDGSNSQAKDLVTDLSIFDLPSSPPPVSRTGSTILANSHLTEESDVIASTKDNTQATSADRQTPQYTPTGILVPSSDNAAPNGIPRHLNLTESMEAGDEEEVYHHSGANSGKNTQILIPSIEVPRTQVGQIANKDTGRDVEELSVVADSFVHPASQAKPTSDEPRDKPLITTPSITIDLTQDEGQEQGSQSQHSEFIADGQASNRPARSTKRLRRRKSPTAIIEEVIRDFEDEPVQKKLKSSNQRPYPIRASQVALSRADRVEEASQEIVRNGDEALDIEREVPTPQTIVERMRLLLEEAKATTSWDIGEQRQIADLAFEFQAISRGR